MAKRNPQAALRAAQAALARKEEEWAGKFADRLREAEGRADRLHDELVVERRCREYYAELHSKVKKLNHYLGLEKEVLTEEVQAQRRKLKEAALCRDAFLGLALFCAVLAGGLLFYV